MKKHQYLKVELEDEVIKKIDSYVKSGFSKSREEFALSAINDMLERYEY